MAPALLLAAFSPTGWHPPDIKAYLLPEVPLEQRLVQAPPSLPLPPATQVLAAIASDRARLAGRASGDPQGWNSHTLALSALSLPSGPKPSRLNLGFAPSDYVSHQALLRLWRESAAATLFTDQPTMFSWNSSSFGLNLALITSDNQLIYTTRSHATRSYGGLLHCAANEALDAHDLTSGRPDLFASCTRGLHEELGLDVPTSAIHLTSLFVHTPDNEWGVTATADLRDTTYTAERVRASHATAPDAWESQVFSIPASPAALTQLLSDPRRWIPAGGLALVLALCTLLGAPAAQTLLPLLGPWCAPSNLAAIGLLPEAYTITASWSVLGPPRL